MARAYGKLPHEMGRGMTLSYFQTLLDGLNAEIEESQPRNDSKEDGLLSVDVDALVRKGRRSGFGTES